MAATTTVTRSIVSFVTGRRTKWVVVLLGFVVAAIFGPLGGKQDLTTDPTAFLPANAQSTQVVVLQRHLPSGQVLPAIVVYASRDPLSGASRKKIAADTAEFRSVAVRGTVPPPEYSADNKAAIVAVPLSSAESSQALDKAVKHLRATAARGLPDGAKSAVGGPAGFVVDLVDAFGGINGALLLATIAVVALVLIITYRSPWLWLVPLAVIGIADQVASAIVYLLAHDQVLVVNGESAGILRVLVFGAGTDYALLLIARYREELREHEDRHAAMERALLGAGPSILASSGTVTISLLVLGLVSTLNNDRSLGFVGAVGIVVALLFALLLLPAVLLLFGRRLFWPFVPELGAADPTLTGTWSRVGRLEARAPRLVMVACAALLAVLALGLIGVPSGLTQAQQFRNRTPSTQAQALIAAHFPAGSSAPICVIADAAAADGVLAAARSTPGVSAAAVTDRTGSLAQISATLTPPPDSPASYQVIRALRRQVAGVPGAHAVVGGSVATDLDTNAAARHDTLVVIPAVLLVVLLILMLLLRAVLGPVILILTVVASYLAAVGATSWAFIHLFGFPAVDASFSLLAFLFLVAFGVDYNIFLVGRARQETEIDGPRQGILTALAVTGGVITSAGVVLASTFAVLTVLPLLFLTEIGIVVAFGVLLDTLVVRSVLVPAIMLSIDRRFWWPSVLGRARAEPRPVGGASRGPLAEE
jgi:RND superfamily putative drug exporter